MKTAFANVLLSDHTTFHLGGPAKEFYQATSKQEVVDLVREADDANTPLLVLGGGSNLLVADAGFAGRVVKTAEKNVDLLEETDTMARVKAGAGVVWDEFVMWTQNHGLAGLISLSGIPGTVGASPVQNIGAYGHEVAECLESVEAYDRLTQEVVTLTNEELRFGYRTSLIKQSLTNPELAGGKQFGPTGRWVVLQVVYKLEKSPLAEPILYAELAKKLGTEVGERAEAALVREAVLELRKSKGMVYDPGCYDCWSAGSFFTNPVLTAAQEQALVAEAPRYPYHEKQKTSAAWLINHAGFDKGFSLANSKAALSSKHVLALTNRGGATTQEVLELAETIKAGVQKTYGITLEMEPVKVGL